MDKSLFSQYLTILDFGKKVKNLGKGSFGFVSLWESQKTGRKVAAKQFKVGQENDISTDTIREISILKSLKHDNVLRILGILAFSVNEPNKKIVIALEAGVSDLKDYCSRDANVNQRLMKHITHELCLGLQYLHHRGVIHRDLKPQNVILFDDGRVAISDFGCARMGAIPGSKYSGPVQTVWWRAPEIFIGDKGNRLYSNKIDVFSVGVILIELYCNVYPLFGKPNEREVLLSEIELLGGFHPEVWPEVEALKIYSDEEIRKHILANRLSMLELKVFPLVKHKDAKLSQELKIILFNMTVANPTLRWDIDKVLDQDWFNDVRREPKVKAPVCGNDFRNTKSRSLLIPDGDIKLSQILFPYVHGYQFCKKQGLNRQTTMHFRFIYDEYCYRAAVKPSEQERIPLMMASIWIASKLYDVFRLSAKTFVSHLESIGLGNLGVNDDKMVYYERLILQTLVFDIGYNTIHEYYNELTSGENLSVQVITVAETISMLYYLLNYEQTFDPKELAHLSLTLASKAFAIEYTKCLKSWQISEDKIKIAIEKVESFVELMSQPFFVSYIGYEDLRKMIVKPEFNHYLGYVTEPKPWEEPENQIPQENQNEPPPQLGSLRKSGKPDSRYKMVFKINSFVDDQGIESVAETEIAGIPRIVIGNTIISYIQMTLLSVLSFKLKESLMSFQGAEPFVEYLHGKLKEGGSGKTYVWDGVSSSNIDISFGIGTSRIEVIVSFFNIPPRFKDDLLQDWHSRIVGGNLGYRIIDGITCEMVLK